MLLFTSSCDTSKEENTKIETQYNCLEPGPRDDFEFLAETNHCLQLEEWTSEGLEDFPIPVRWTEANIFNVRRLYIEIDFGCNLVEAEGSDKLFDELDSLNVRNEGNVYGQWMNAAVGGSPDKITVMFEPYANENDLREV